MVVFALIQIIDFFQFLDIEIVDDQMVDIEIVDTYDCEL
jgi:hypothetical protein